LLIKNGYIEVADTIGLGAEIDEKAAKKFIQLHN